MRLYTALVELIEAKAEYIREDTATLQLGKFAEGYQAGVEDTSGFEIVYSDETDEQD